MGRGYSVSGDEKAGDEVLARAAGLAVSLEGESGEVGGGGSDRVAVDGKAGEQGQQFGFV